MKTVIIYFVYAMTLFNFYIWMINPALSAVTWKWSIFMALLIAPMIYILREKKQPVDKL